MLTMNAVSEHYAHGELLTSIKAAISKLGKTATALLEIKPEYTIVEKTGHEHETQELFERLKSFKIRQFTRSGRVAVTKLRKELLSNYLAEVDKKG